MRQEVSVLSDEEAYLLSKEHVGLTTDIVRVVEQAVLAKAREEPDDIIRSAAQRYIDKQHLITEHAARELAAACVAAERERMAAPPVMIMRLTPQAMRPTRTVGRLEP